MTTIIGPPTSTPTANKMRSTFVYGVLGNLDKTDGSIQAVALFQRNVTIGGNLTLGTETIDSSGNAVDSGGNIQFTLNKVLYSIPLRTLSYLMNVTSDIQQQISNISSSGSSSTQHPSSLTVGGQYQNNSGDFSAFTNTFFVAPIASFNSGLNANSISSFYDISFNRFINGISKTVFGYLANVTSDIQQQINNVSTSISNIGNNPLVLFSTLNVSGLTTLTQTQINTSLSVLQNISFIGTLNNISANTFSFLSGLTSNIQNQINNINNTTSPVGSVISYAGTTASLTGYLPCDGSQYPISSYVALFNAIQYTYGGNSTTGYFCVPNYKGIFLRGAGTQAVNLNVIAGRGGPIQKTYNSPSLGQIFTDETTQSTTSDYVNGITQEVKSFITGANAFGPPNYNFNYSNAVASLQYTTGHDTINSGYTETFPVHTSINYFIKY